MQSITLDKQLESDQLLAELLADLKAGRVDGDEFRARRKECQEARVRESVADAMIDLDIPCPF